MVTFVCAATVMGAERWCRANDVPVTAVTTRIVTPRSPHGGRGRRFGPQDRVVVLVDEGDWNDGHVWRYVRGALAPCGLGTVVQPEFVT